MKKERDMTQDDRVKEAERLVLITLLADAYRGGGPARATTDEATVASRLMATGQVHVDILPALSFNGRDYETDGRGAMTERQDGGLTRKSAWEALANARVQVWTCIVPGHRHVEWTDDVARCVEPGCEVTSEHTKAFADLVRKATEQGTAEEE